MNIFRCWDFVFRFHCLSLGNFTSNTVNDTTYTTNAPVTDSYNSTTNSVANLSNSGNTTGGNTFVGTGSQNPLVDQISSGAASVFGSGNTIYYVIGAALIGLLLFFNFRKN